MTPQGQTPSPAAQTSSMRTPAETTTSVRTRMVDGIAVVTFDAAGEKQNTLNEATTTALMTAFGAAEANAAVQGIVIISGKPDFIAGADITRLAACASAMEAERLSHGLQQELLRIERCKKPVVAAIHGACLGGGLELALACAYRIGTDDARTALGLPEVMLGLLPGGGGTQRLPRLIGLTQALDMLLTGKSIRSKNALRMGLLDEVTLPYGLEDAAVTSCRRLIDGTRAHHERRRSRATRAKDAALEENPAGRAVLFRQARAQVQKKTAGLFPAPRAILDVVEGSFGKDADAGYALEAQRFGELAMTPESASLKALFFAQTALKKNRFGPVKKQVETLGVLGAGLMGAGIAEVSVQKGMRVLLKDTTAENIARGQRAIYAGLDKRVRSRAMTPFERDRTFSQIVPKLDFRGFTECDLVIEAVFEDLAVKHAVLRALEEHTAPHCIIATNTSALPIHKIAEALKRPENVVGMHYFSPVPKMPLLEVVTHPRTSKEATALAVDTGIRQGKTVIVVKDGPGFYTSRILGPMLDEAVTAALEGVALLDIDDAVHAFGFPVGPITLLDEVGVDVAAHVARDMAPFFEARTGPRDRVAFDEMVSAGLLGKKAGRGFYLYGDGAKRTALGRARAVVERALGGGRSGRQPNPAALAILGKYGAPPGSQRVTAAHDLALRICLRMVNEAVHCLQDGILASAQDGDVGAVFGLGFPPHTGGPFRLVDSMGASAVVSALERFANRWGKRFTPAPLLVEHAKTGARFYPRG